MLRPMNDGHAHAFRYFSGMSSCCLCAASVRPDGTIDAPTERSKAHRLKGLEATREAVKDREQNRRRW